MHQITPPDHSTHSKKRYSRSNYTPPTQPPTDLTRIGILSDTHSYLDEQLFDYFEECHEIWHIGDVGDPTVTDRLQAFRPLRAVYGNIDGRKIRAQFPEDAHFEVDGVRVFMTHIGGYPGRYNARVRGILTETRPKLYLAGHSHILKVMPDRKLDLLHINPGAAGNHGWHKVRTAIRLTLDAGRIGEVQVIELGHRGRG